MFSTSSSSPCYGENELFRRAFYYTQTLYSAPYVVRFLLQHGATYTEKELQDALGFAILKGRLRVVELLVDAGADIRANTNKAVYRAASVGNLAIVRYLIEKGADIQSREYDILYWTASRGHLDVIVFLASHGLNIHLAQYMALRVAAEFGHVDVVRYMVENGADIHAQEDYALRWAACGGFLDVVRYLVQVGASIDAKNHFALVWAASNGHAEVVRFLIKMGADIHVQNNHAFRRAVHNGRLEIAQFLLDMIPEPRASSVKKDALVWTARDGELVGVQFLLGKGTDVHAENDLAVHWAARYGRFDVVSCLLDHGASETVAFEQAKQMGRTEMMLYIQGRHMTN